MPRVGNLSLNQLIELIKLYGGGSGGGGGGSGDVTGPGSSTGNAVARFDGTGGKTLKNSGVTVDDSDNIFVPGNLHVGEYIYRSGDTNTNIRFTDDDINFRAGGVNFIDLTQDTVSEITFNEAAADVDFRVESVGNTHMLYVDAGNNRVGVGTAPSCELHVSGADPRIRADSTAGNHPGFELSEAGTRKWVIYNDPDESHNLMFKSSADRMELTQDGDLQIDGDLTVEGSDIVIKNGSKTATISIDSNGNVTITPSDASARVRLAAATIENKDGSALDAVDGLQSVMARDFF